MNNKRLTEIIQYYEQLSTNTEVSRLEENRRIKKSKNGKRKKDNNNNTLEDNDINDFTINVYHDMSKYEIYQPDEDTNDSTYSFIPKVKPNIVYYCSKCKHMFRDESQFNEHVMNHSVGNSACFCRTCNLVFDNDIEYYEHANACQGEISNKDEDNIPEDPNGEYECPTCHKKYNNQFFVGEHFIKAHNDYSVFCDLDKVDHNGFPGFDILKKIDMIEDINNKENEICDICCFNFEDNIFINDNEINEDDRSSVILKCCERLICRDCLMHHIIESDSIVCPFCRKDHTRTDWDYVIFVEPMDTTDREKWLPWWEEHIDIFSYK